MSDSEEDSIGSSISSDSEFSDCDSRDESPSSGYVDDESASVRSESTTSRDSKKKKKVTFQSDENLVLIREIPARSLLGRWTLESDSASDGEEESPPKGTVSQVSDCMAKGNYEVRKSTGRTAAKVAAITGATLPKKAEGKRTVRRRSVKRDKRKEVPSQSSNETEEPLKAKGRNGRVKGGKKHCNKTNKSKVKERGEQKEGGEVPGVSVSKDVTVKGQVANCQDSFKDPSEPKPSVLDSSSAVRIVNLLDNSCDKALNPIQKIEKVYIVEEEFSHNSRDVLDAMIQSSDRIDVRAMSKTNRRLYSWLMANGNIPSPQQESPCIAPMWDSASGAVHGTHHSVVKAPT